MLAGDGVIPEAQLISYINVKLALLGCQPVVVDNSAESSDIVSILAAQYQEKVWMRWSAGHRY